MKAKQILSIGALALLSFTSSAELKSMDDEVLSSVTGQKGLTIDIDYGVEIAEFMYKDAGALVMQGIRVGGMNHCDDTTIGASGGSYTCDEDNVGTSFNAVDGIAIDNLDPQNPLYGPLSNSHGTTGRNNIRIEVDIAGDGSDLGNNGFIPHPLAGFPDIPIPDNQFFWAWGQFTNSGGLLGCGGNGNCNFVAGDGDLFIHGKPIDNFGPDAYSIGDFGMEMDRFALKDSNYVAGDDINNLGGSAGVSQETTIISDFRMEGYDGAFDILLENKGNGFGEYDSVGGFTETGVGDAASKIRWNHMFEITEMEYTFDIAGIRYEKMRVHNRRGDRRMFDFLTQEDFGLGPATGTSVFAQSVTNIYAVKDNVISLNSAAGVNGSNNRADYVDGITLDSRFVGDMDIGHMSFGDTDQSIGEQYWTDMDIDTVLTISAH
jgi:Family of unknown function (DUF6160)